MNYQLSPKTVSRVIDDELIVIQLDTGRYHYFSKDTDSFLNSFKDGLSPDDYASAYELDPVEKKHILELCQWLHDRNILVPQLGARDRKCLKDRPYRRPQFLRDGEKTLDQISFASP